jgi:hypothetical protein
LIVRHRFAVSVTLMFFVYPSPTSHCRLERRHLVAVVICGPPQYFLFPGFQLPPISTHANCDTINARRQTRLPMTGHAQMVQLPVHLNVVGVAAESRIVSFGDRLKVGRMQQGQNWPENRPMRNAAEHRINQRPSYPDKSELGSLR